MQGRRRLLRAHLKGRQTPRGRGGVLEGGTSLHGFQVPNGGRGTGEEHCGFWRGLLLRLWPYWVCLLHVCGDSNPSSVVCDTQWGCFFAVTETPSSSG